MKRVYTDPRFPGFEVHNDGSNVFHVYETIGNQQQEIDSFTTMADPNGVSEQAASARAKAYFDRMYRAYSGEGRHNMSAELKAREADAANTPVQQKQPPGEPFGLSASKSLDQLMGDNVLTADQVISAWEHANAMPEGPEKEAALAQVRSMSGQLESSADELVRRLID